MGGLKGLCKFKGKSAGRNSSGRITIFHRGGGAKRLQRRIDLKRSTASMGVVERVEYDPNRSARIALVRWMGDMQVPPPRKCEKMGKPAPLRKTVDPSTTNVRGIFSFCAMPGTRIVDHHQWRKTHPKDVFFSSFSVPKAGGVSLPLPLPRVAIAGANPAFLAMRVARQFAGKDTSSLREVQKCTPKDNIVWAHRIKPKAALSWQSSRQQETLGLVMPQKTATAKKTVFHKVGGK